MFSSPALFLLSLLPSSTYVIRLLLFLLQRQRHSQRQAVLHIEHDESTDAGVGVGVGIGADDDAVPLFVSTIFSVSRPVLLVALCVGTMLTYITSGASAHLFFQEFFSATITHHHFLHSLRLFFSSRPYIYKESHVPCN